MFNMLLKKYFPRYFELTHKNMYKVEYIIKTEFISNKISYLNILIKSLNLQFYSKRPVLKFEKYTERLGDYNIIPFSHTEMLGSDYKVKFIEITPELQLLLCSNDELNQIVGTQIIFNKLGITLC